MILINNKPAKYKCGGITIMPGKNSLDDKAQPVKDFLNHPGVKKRLEIGEFALKSTNESVKTVDVPEDKSDSVDFNAMSLSEIKQYIAESNDLDKLRHIANNDNRKTVINAAQERYAEIKKKG